MECRANDCTRKAVCKGLCDKHYRRLLKHGSENDYGNRVVDEGNDLERFHKKYKVDDETGCWLWIAGTRPNSKGVLYGRHHMQKGGSIGAHRFSYMTHVGPIPDGKYVCHRCDTPLCVNPDHLFVGSHSDNMKDMVNKGRSFRGRGEKKKGKAKLTNEEAKEILNMDGTYSEIGKIYGVSASVIGRIKRLESYN